MIDFNALQQPNVFGTFQAGLQLGQEQKRQRVTQNALAAYAQNPDDPNAVSQLMAVDPQLGLKIREDQRSEMRRENLAKVFAPASGEPTSLVDPAQLPPRTDGVQINHQALRALYATDPEQAMDIQKLVYNMDKAGAERAKEHGSVMARAAYILKRVPPEQRQAELQAMMPQLQAVGLSPQMVSQADLSDAGLDRYIALGQTLSELIKGDQEQWRVIPEGGTMVNVNDPAALAQFSKPSGPIRVTSPEQLNTLAPGTEFIAPDGSIRRVPGGPTPSASGSFRQ